MESTDPKRMRVPAASQEDRYELTCLGALSLAEPVRNVVTKTSAGYVYYHCKTILPTLALPHGCQAEGGE